MPQIPCPVCGADIDVTVHRTRGDVVPYGSTTARLPDSYEAEPAGDCPNGCILSDEQYDRLTDQAIEAWSDYDPRDERPDRYDED